MFRFWPIMRLSLSLALRRRVVRLAVLLGVLSSLAIVGWYVMPVKAASYTAYLKGVVHSKQEFWAWVLAALVGSGVVANDRRTHAFHVYFSRPVRGLDYVVGKGAGLGVLLALVTVLPSVLILLTDLGVEGIGAADHRPMFDVRVVGEATVREIGFATVLWSVVAYQTVYIASVAALALALSSLVRRAGPAGAALLGYHFLSLIVVKVGVARAPETAAWLPLLSLHHVLSRVGDHLYGLPLSTSGPHLGVCLLVVCGVAGASMWVVFRGLRLSSEGA